MGMVPSVQAGSDAVTAFGRKARITEGGFVPDLVIVAQPVRQARLPTCRYHCQTMRGEGGKQAGLAEVIGIVGAVGDLALEKDFGDFF